MARPPKDPEFLRSRRIDVLVSPHELQQLERLAALHSVPVRRYLRETGLSRQLPPAMPTINQATYVELRRVGSNINQLTHLAHLTGSRPDVQTALRDMAAALEAIRADLLDPLAAIEREHKNRRVFDELVSLFSSPAEES